MEDVHDITVSSDMLSSIVDKLASISRRQDHMQGLMDHSQTALTTALSELADKVSSITIQHTPIPPHPLLFTLLHDPLTLICHHKNHLGRTTTIIPPVLALLNGLIRLKVLISLKQPVQGVRSFKGGKGDFRRARTRRMMVVVRHRLSLLRHIKIRGTCRSVKRRGVGRDGSVLDSDRTDFVSQFREGSCESSLGVIHEALHMVLTTGYGSEFVNNGTEHVAGNCDVMDILHRLESG